MTGNQRDLDLGLDWDGLGGRSRDPAYHQPDLWEGQSGAIVRSLPRIQGRPQMGAQALDLWKGRIHRFQEQVRHTPPPTQGGLWGGDEWGLCPDRPGDEITGGVTDGLHFDPLALAAHPFEFYELPEDPSPSTPVIYFVIDRAAGLILYIGEAVRARSRWAGPHDCKRYYRNYYTLHQELGQAQAVGLSFWGGAFPDAKRRRQQELWLIRRWRSPFNKENWRFWGTPFMDGKAIGDR